MKEERIRAEFAIANVQVAGDPIVAHDPSILAFRVAKADSSLEDGELEATFEEKPVMENAKRKHTEVAKLKFNKKARADSCSSSSSGGSAFPKQQYETDPETLARRQKQIDFGKNTLGYDNYIATVPKEKRTKEHPRTPPMQLKYSRRAWDGIVKKWRKQLHEFDTEGEENAVEEEPQADESLLY